MGVSEARARARARARIRARARVRVRARARVQDFVARFLFLGSKTSTEKFEKLFFAQPTVTIAITRLHDFLDIGLVVVV